MQRRVLMGAGAAIIATAAFAGVELAGRHDAGNGVARDIDQITASLPPGYTATHGPTDVNPITGTVTVKNLAVVHDGKQVYFADTVTLTGVDQQALHDVFDPDAYQNGHPAWTSRRLLIADATASGVRISDDGQAANETRIRSITMHQLSGRPFQLPPTRENAKTAAFRADAALAFALQSLDVHDLSVQAQAPRPTTLALGSFTVRDYDGGKLGKAAMQGFAMDATNDKPTRTAIHATLDSFEIRDVDAAAQLRQRQLDQTPSFAGMRGGALKLSGLDIEISPGPSITLTAAEAHGSPAGDSGPGTGDAALRGLTFALKDTPMAAGPAALVAAFGMNAITMDIETKSTSDPSAGIVKITEDVALQQLGALHLSLAAGLKSPASPGQDPRAALLSTPIDHAIFEWHDEGLVNRALNAAAAQTHTTPDAVRAQLAMPLLTLGFLMPDQPDVADQLTSFITHPGTLTITLDPPQPVTFAEIGQAPAEARAHLLGVHIQAK
jgi:hypothetical protein